MNKTLSRSTRSKLLTTFEEAILLAIGNDNLNGWDIMTRINTALGKKKGYSFGTLYPALFRLRDEKLLKATLDEQKTTNKKQGAKQKYLYQVTDKGREALKDSHSFRSNLTSGKEQNVSNEGIFVTQPAY